MNEDNIVQTYKHRIRILLLLYVFSEEYNEESHLHYKRLFEGEMKIQKLDFWLRNPDYLSYELLKIAQQDHTKKVEIKGIVRRIFQDGEPDIRREEMLKFRFGAYEDLDDVIAFLESRDLIKFDSKRATDSTIRNKKYYVTETAVKTIESNISTLSFLNWYIERCNLIKRFFGSKTATELKDAQYEIEQYSRTLYGNPIENIIPLVKQKFNHLYNQDL